MATNNHDEKTNHLTTKNKIVKISNELLEICQNYKCNSLNQYIPKQINNYREINSNLFVYFYENICNNILVDKKSPPSGIEDEIHNVQSVIDSLSMDVLHEDLSHLTGEAICGYNKSRIKHNKAKPDFISIEYLLDILRSIHDWIHPKLDNKTNSTGNITSLSEDIYEESKKNTIQYHTLNKQIEETIEITKKSLNLKETTFNSNDLFKTYMNEKEKEFDNRQSINIIQNKSETDNEELKFCNSSSGNSSLSEYLASLSSQNSIEDTSKHVQFNLKIVNDPLRKSRSTSLSRHENTNIQTVDNEFKLIKASLDNNKLNKQNKISNLLKAVYDEDLKDADSIHRLSLSKIKNKSDLTNQLFMSAYCPIKIEPIKKSTDIIRSSSTKSKSVLLPKSKSLINFSRSKSSFSGHAVDDDLIELLNNHQNTKLSGRNHSTQFLSRFTIGDNGILEKLLQEFPYLYSSPETIHYLWQKHAKHIETLTKAKKELEFNILNHNNKEGSISNRSDVKVEAHLKEAYNKQQMFMAIMRKELSLMQRIQDLKRRQQVENSLKAKMREQRFTNAKVKRYYEEFRLEQKAKMLKQSTSEELIFKRLFNESLKLQKERILELRKYAKEKSEINTKKYMNQLQSIENYYKNKFDLLNERMQKEKQNELTRDKAQNLFLTKMKKQTKSKMENEIKELQEQMYRDKDFLYWRKLDAKRLKNEINKADYFNQYTASY